MADPQITRPVIVPGAQGRNQTRIYVPPVGGRRPQQPPVVAPTTSEPYQTQGANPLSRAYSKMQDPRVSAWLLNVAKGLAQPRTPGRTGVTNAVDALSAGYDSLSASANAQYERRRQEELMQMGREKHASDLETAQTGRSNVEAEIVQSGFENTNLEATTGLRKAQTVDLDAAAENRTGRLNLEQDRFEQSKKVQQYVEQRDSDSLRFREKELLQQADQETKQLELERTKLNQRADEAEVSADIARRRNEIATRQTEAAMIGALASATRAAKVGTMTDSRLAGIAAKVGTDYLNSMAALNDRKTGKDPQKESQRFVSTVLQKLRKEGLIPPIVEPEPVVDSLTTDSGENLKRIEVDKKGNKHVLIPSLHKYVPIELYEEYRAIYGGEPLPEQAPVRSPSAAPIDFSPQIPQARKVR